MFRAQQSDLPASPEREDSLYSPPPENGRERGDYPGHVARSSAYTRAALRPGLALLGLTAAGLTVAYATGRGPFRRESSF